MSSRKRLRTVPPRTSGSPIPRAVHSPWRSAAIACPAFFAALLWLYWPALKGRLVFDDLSLPFSTIIRDHPLHAWVSGVRPTVFPAGQSIDQDYAPSHTILEHGAIFCMILLAAVVVLSIRWCRRYPVCCFGLLMFLIWLAPWSNGACICPCWG